MDVHSGTHVDAPSHLIDGGVPVASLGIDAFVGRVRVVDASGLRHIDGDAVERLVPAGTPRVLFRSNNSVRRLMRQRQFVSDFVAVAVTGAQALAARPEMRLVGNDYLSIQPFGGDNESHLALMRRRIAILEGLDLTDVQPGEYELLAVPLRLDETEAAPVRALLRACRDLGS
jgi:arylformamidase